MAVICPTCGTSNADGNKFCANCGTALAAATPPPAVTPPPTPAATPPAPAPAPPPADATPSAQPPQPPVAAATTTSPAVPVAAATPASVAPPSGTPGPSPVGGTPPPPRVPSPILYGGLLAGVLIAAVIGVAAGSAFASSGGKNDPTPTPYVKPTAAATPRSTPDTDSTPKPTQAPVDETPAPVTPTPTPEVATPSTGTGGASQFVDVANIAITVPGDWKVAATKDYLIDVRGPKGGQLVTVSYVRNTKTTLDTYIQSIIDLHKKNAPDLTVCLAPTAVTLDNGPAGKEFALCWTATTQSGETYPAVADFAVAISDDGMTAYSSEVYARKELFVDFAKSAFKDVTPTTKWKLYKAP